jgi:hypothetical protein
MQPSRLIVAGGFDDVIRSRGWMLETQLLGAKGGVSHDLPTGGGRGGDLDECAARAPFDERQRNAEETDQGAHVARND